MPDYVVQIIGSNFLVNMSGSPAKHGFYAFRLVEAADEEAAGLIAVQRIREDQELRDLVLNDEGDPPTMDVDDVQEISSPNDVDVPPGRIWFEMNPKRWWQFWRR